MTYDKFTSKIIIVGNSKAIIIPSNIIKYSGLKEEMIVEVMIKKKDEKKQE